MYQSPVHFYLGLQVNIHHSSLSYGSADSRSVPNDSVDGDTRKNFSNGSFILLHRQTDHNLINRNAAVYLHTLAKIFLYESVTSVPSIKRSLFREWKNSFSSSRDSRKFENQRNVLFVPFHSSFKWVSHGKKKEEC